MKFFKNIFVLLIFGGFFLIDGQPSGYGVSGYVFDNSRKIPVSYAAVIFPGQKKKVFTDEGGRFDISVNQPGIYEMEIVAPDYEKKQLSVTVSEENPHPDLSIGLDLRNIKASSIDIIGERDVQKVARTTIDQKELKEIPATLGDSVNALSSFAGIDQFSFLAGLGPLIIRGADSFSNRYYIDGIPVNLIQHMLGLHSVINNNLIDKIDVYMSDAPVSYGNSALGGVIELNTIDSVKKFGGSFELSILSANGDISAPILKDPKDKDSAVGYWFASGRYGYLTALMPPILKALTGEAPALPQYYDYQLKGRYNFDKYNSLSVLILGFGDEVDSSNSLSEKSRAKAIQDGADPFFVDMTNRVVISSHIQSIGLDYSKSDRLVNKIKAYSALNETTQALNSKNPNAPSWMKNLERTANPNIFGIKDELLFKLFENHSSTKLGAEFTYYNFHAFGTGIVPKKQFVGANWSQFDSTEAAFDKVQINQNSNLYLISGYIEEKIEYGGLTVGGGARADYFENDNLFSIDPRGFVSYEFPTDTIISAGAGSFGSFGQTNFLFFSQAPEIAEAKGLEVEKAYHHTVGFEQKINKVYNIKLEGFYNKFEKLMQAASGIGNSGLGLNSGQREVYGIELTIGKDQTESRNDFYGWINYTWMQGKQKTGLPLSFDPEGNNWINNEYGREHSLKIVAGYKFGRNNIGARFRLLSSLPYTPIIGDDGDPFGIGRFGPIYGKRYSEYYPLYHQLDLRFSRTENLKWGRLTWYIEIQNVYNNHAPVLSWKYNKPYSPGKNPIIDTGSGIGILPSFGVEFQF